MRRWVPRVFIIFGVVGTGLFLFKSPARVVEFEFQGASIAGGRQPRLEEEEAPVRALTSSTPTSSLKDADEFDVERQPRLSLRPQAVKAIYATGWTAGSTKRINALIDLIDQTELNAIVIDVKDYSGYVSYRTDSSLVKDVGAEKEIRIAKPNALIKQLHDKGIYTIARITVFQDPVAARAHPEWALKKKGSSELWQDDKGLMWLDPSSPEVWHYNVEIAEDAARRGFDEINFDYIRFPTDGATSEIDYPHWRGEEKHEVIENFFRFLRGRLSGVPLSADIFGLATVEANDLGIGQDLEVILPYFDFVMPMVYPSHYAHGFNGFVNPAEHPYEVIQYSMEKAVQRLMNFGKESDEEATSTTATSTQSTRPALATKLRPWLQDFDLGAEYTADMVRKEIQAAYASGKDSPQALDGWALWNPSNHYTSEALESN